MQTDYEPGSNGVLIVASREYYVNGWMVMAESKSVLNSSNFDNITLFHFNTNDVVNSAVEMFTRQSDGSVKPAPTTEVEAYKKEMAVSLLFFKVFGGGATNHIKDTVISPDGKRKAVVFERAYGALSSFNRQVMVIGNSESPFEYDPDKVLIDVTADGEASKFLSQVEVSWKSENEINIKYPIGSSNKGPRLVGTNSQPPIKVTYKSFDVK
jgi:hypothetical protein